MKLLKQRLVLLSPVIILAVVLIFSLTMIPSINPTPTNLPIAVVTEDAGVTLPNQQKLNMGDTIVENIQNANEEDAVHWIEVNSEEEVRDGLNHQDYYAALVIPENFSQKQASLQTQKPSAPEVQILVNQGMNTAAANAASQILNQVVDNVNHNVRTQVLEGFEKQGGTVTTTQASALVTPITKKVVNVNEIGTHSANGNAPVSLFQPIWMGSIIGSVILFLVINRLVFTNRIETLAAKLTQVLVGGVLALLVGFGATWISDNWIGIDIPRFTDTALFLSITYFSFFLMISAILSWIGLRGIPIFILTLFFGAPLLAMAPEFMSDFYREWIYSWLPMRFMVEGLRELFFFDQGLRLNAPTTILLEIGFVSLLVLLASALKPILRTVPEKETVVQTQLDA
ncbi:MULTISPECIES: YhgE/Pip domain-containing protein [Bacillus]|uniref:Phage infection protein n=2 Tax=Bacillus TaxID=1386 RepID=A0A0M4FTQ2_9BACI|nr:MULTISPECIES: DUF3533 domain-containing protein [Bacillus]ALC83121.1 phage infection protein [Bacillus gobiensis]MBP1082183.1 YhgE/Pip-like protein [Bacillus capparidis]MED1096797.1 DUF3533 domain-containing protein [Bacillus capparidis]